MAHGLPAEGGRFTIAAVAFDKTAGRLRRHSLGGADLLPVVTSQPGNPLPRRPFPAGGHPAATEAVATGRSHALRGEWRPKGSWAASTIASSTARRLRRHSSKRRTAGRADLPPVAASSRSHPAATEAVATDGSHALRGGSGRRRIFRNIFHKYLPTTLVEDRICENTFRKLRPQEVSP